MFSSPQVFDALLFPSAVYKTVKPEGELEYYHIASGRKWVDKVGNGKNTGVENAKILTWKSPSPF